MKQKVEAVDEETSLYIYSVIEETKLEASPNGGSICKTSSKYYTIGDFELKEEGIEIGKEKALGNVQGH
ncbi:hypothetical protein GOBAR_AA11814 [Gossypium barbadense]|uniref:Bet v I/Major latex protein domain-containing protein n=1 Tax=Gossypium barbadense TaxID=3634 RepID=A0A2P5XZQ3_GOSBA|nr:hypothetical protein GOBAR_AA11814 [Gossypium barbadense]